MSEYVPGALPDPRNPRPFLAALSRLGEEELEILVGLVADSEVEAFDEVWAALHELTDQEVVRRRWEETAAEAILNGGHLTLVVESAEVAGRFEAWCDPYPWETEWETRWGDRPGLGQVGLCFQGPPRSTVAEALEDAGRHAPGVAPKMTWRLNNGG